MSRAHMPPQTWERFSNDPWDQRQAQRQEAAQVVEEDEDEWAMLRREAECQDLKFSVHRGVIRVGRASFPETERGVEQAWEYLDEGGSAA